MRKTFFLHRILRTCQRLGMALMLMSIAAPCAKAEGERLRLVHTNDLQSRLLGFDPNADYTPESLNDDASRGGIARVATLIRQAREEAPDHTLVLDGGDILMGTLFHTISRESATELEILAAIGYDAAVLGNHEFDFRPDGLAATIQSAADLNALPPLVISNLIFDPEDPADDALEQQFLKGALRDHLVVERAGLKIGIFGLLGADAAEVAPYAKPVRFAEPLAVARERVRALREEEQVDVVICLSHGGVHRNASDSGWEGEDLELAAVPGLDIVVGGHSHTPLFEPLRVGDTLVLQAGSEGRYVGVLDVEVDQGKVAQVHYELQSVDDSVPAAADIQDIVLRAQLDLDASILGMQGLRFEQVLAETEFDLLLDETTGLTDSNLGPFAADAVLWGVERALLQAGDPNPHTDLALTTAGLVRDSILRGNRGQQQVSDLFRVLPLGIGTVEDTVGFPLARVFVTGHELRSILEVLCFAYRDKGTSYYPYFSGLRYTFNPNRLVLDRVVQVEFGNEVDGFRTVDLEPERLYSVGMNGYILKFFGVIGDMSHGLVSVVPKDAKGQAVEDLSSFLIDGDPQTPGIQEVKEWRAFLDFASHFPDRDGNGVADIPERYRELPTRLLEQPSWDPRLLVKNSTGVMGVALLLGFISILLAFYLLFRWWKSRS